MANPLEQLHSLGQSIWLDYIDRTMLHNGDLSRRLSTDVLTGMTSNPSIFEKALAQGTAYDAQLKDAAGDKTAWEMFELVETDDVRAACDSFRPIYDSTKGHDGFVSIEVSPGSAHDSAATITEAHRLWQTVSRPNVMIKVPGTAEGAIAVRRLIADGINVNITLLFSIDAHQRVIEAYLGGLEDRVQTGAPVAGIASVASFFVSRVDTEVEKRLDALVKSGACDANHADMLRGKAAIANAKLAYRLFRESFAGARWDALAAKGAQLQRPLWASTSTKNPAYRDVLYVEQLIGPDTVNTMPPATIEAFRDHGIAAKTVDEDLDSAERVISDLAAVGIPLVSVTDQLLTEGLASFQKSFDTLIAGLDSKAKLLGRSLAASR